MSILLAIPAICFLGFLAIILALRKKWLAALVFLAAAVILNSATQQIPVRFGRSGDGIDTTGTRVRIFEYNTCAEDRFQHKHDSTFIDYIISQDADILFLPENLYYVDRELDTALSKVYPYGVFHQIPSGKQPEELTLYSRFPLKDVKRLPSPTVAEGSDGMVMATAEIGGRDVTLVHLHFTSSHYGIKRGYDLREKELETIRPALDTVSTPMIICGDLNDLSGSPTLKGLQEYGLRNAWWTHGCGPGFTFKKGILRFRLDHLLYSPDIQVEKIKVDRKADFSDHYPIIADLIVSTMYRTSSSVTYGPLGRHIPTLNMASETDGSSWPKRFAGRR